MEVKVKVKPNLPHNNVSIAIQKANTKSSVGQHEPPTNAKYHGGVKKYEEGMGSFALILRQSERKFPF
jgi:hypothetical protein